MTFLRSVAAIASVLFSTLRALPATAQTAPASATPAPQARLVLPPYPVSFAAARRYEPNLRLELRDRRTRQPLLSCVDQCQALVHPGRYRLYVGPTLHTNAGERGLDITAPSRILVTPPEGGTGKAVGLTLGIAGPILTLAGAVLVLAASNERPGSTAEDVKRYTGFGMLVGGAAITPLGWVMYAKSKRPGVEIQPY